MNRYRIQRPAFSENALCFATFLFMICALAAGCAQETNQDESVPVKRLVDEVHTFTRLFPAAAHLNRLTEKGAEVTGTWGIIPEAPQVYFTDYLVIGPTELIEAIDDLIVYRDRQGYRVRRGLLENILEDYPADSVPESVRAYLQDHVQSPGNTLALLVGSHATIPMVWFETDSSSGAEWSYDLYTDGFYADLHSDSPPGHSASCPSSTQRRRGCRKPCLPAVTFPWSATPPSRFPWCGIGCWRRTTLRFSPCWRSTICPIRWISKSTT